LRPPRAVGNAEGIINALLARFGLGGFANREGLTILTLELNGDPILARQSLSKPLPA